MRRNIVSHVEGARAVGWLYRTKSVDVRTTFSSETFSQVPPEWRVDLTELSELEPDRRLLPDP